MIKNIDHKNVIHYGADSLIVYVKKNEAGSPYCLKILNEEFPSAAQLTSFDNEFELCLTPQAGCIRKAIQKTQIENHHAIAFEYIDGTNLGKYITTHALSLSQKLSLAAEIALALSEIQKQNIFHGQLHPSNILVEKGTNKIYLIDFATAAILNSAILELQAGKTFKPEALPYLAPEQTGRINRTIDFRADLYSMGIIFFQLFTGQLPFDSSDAGGLLYSHIAKTPPAPVALQPALPQVLSDIVLKLLAKNAEDRYQSAFGVYYDLERSINALQGEKVIPTFELATNDFSGKYYPQQKLHGRNNELKTLYNVFEECAEGEKRMLIVSGYSGSGKSALINEVKQPIARGNGLFISGKFDPLQTGTPYSAFSQAFTELKKCMLAEEPFLQQEWKKRIREGLGNTGALLNDIVPGIETLIGKQEEVSDLKGTEAQNRFNYTLLNFLRATAQKEQPLVIFLDDLQWADASSLNLLKVIMDERSLQYFMIIGAYRLNEVHPAHPLIKVFADLKAAGVFFDDITLDNLSYSDVLGLIEDLLHTRQPDAFVLAEIVYNKTKGNAFYVHQFLKLIYEENILHFDFDTRKWFWKTELIEQMNVSGNVVDLMTGLIQRLPEKTIDILKTASCIGNRFDIRTLSLTRQLSEKEIADLLAEPLAVGLIMVFGQQYKFSHDRIQQAIYSLSKVEEKKQIHLLIARALSAVSTETDLQEKIFDIVNQWNIAADLITDNDTRFYLANLNVTAARKAIVSTAYPQALQYYEKALFLVDQSYWSSNYAFILELTGEAAEAAYLCGDYNKVDEIVSDIIKHSRNLIDLTKGYEISIKKLIAQTKLMEAIRMGLDILKKLGIRLSTRPGKISTLSELIITKWSMRNKNADYFIALPEMTDKEKNALMRILSDISSAAYFAAPELVPLLIFKMVRLTIRYGLSRNSPYSFAAYGFILSAYMGEIDKGITYGQIALDIVKKLKADELNTLILTTNNVFLTHWRRPLRDTMEDLEKAFANSLQSGDHEWGAYAAHNIAYQLFFMGFPLKELAHKTELLDIQVEKFRQDLTIRRLRIYRQSIQNLVEITESPAELKGAFLNESEMNEADVSDNNKIYFHNLYFQKCILALIFNLDEAAYSYAGKTGEYLESVRGSAMHPLHFFYQSLAITGLFRALKKRITKTDIGVLKKNIGRMKRFEKLCPANYKYKRMFLEAEYYFILGDNILAKSRYDEALKAASEEKMFHDLALCWERAGEFFMDTNEEVLARFYLQNAYKTYRRWGAEAKLQQMKTRYRQLANIAEHDPDAEIADNRQKQLTEDIDLSTVIKAAAALSGEIVLANLLKKLMQITLESAGAQSGFFIMEKEGEQFIEAEINVEKQEVKTLQSLPVKQSGLLSESVVNYVFLTREVVILDNAVQSNLFGNDEYIRSNRSKSILCLPLLNQGKLQGIIYLSNNLTAGAFTEKRLALLKLLTGQIAISVENALFYSDLENKVRDRTAELEIEKKKSDDLLLNILPEETASELKQTGYTRPRSYGLVTIMFTDFKNFTIQSEKLSPEELVTLIDTYFRKFDEIISKYHLEKIKTIGDAYLCLSGLPNPDEHNAANVVKAAQEILAYIKSLRDDAAMYNTNYFDIRIGIHSGPVVAGVVGYKKFSYDIWGDTVNTAARMEQNSETNRINISQNTYALIKDQFKCTFRGKQPAKNKGMIDMYFVETETNVAYP